MRISRIFCAGVAAFLPALAYAGDALPPLSPAPAQKTYVFHLTLEEAQDVAFAVTDLPYKKAAPILIQMQSELAAQVAAEKKGSSK